MQHKTVYLLFCKFTLHVSGATLLIIRSTQNCNYSPRNWSHFLCSYLPPTWPSLATLEGGRFTVPETVFTVLCIPDVGCGWHPKHVEWTCRIINRLFCVASSWTGISRFSSLRFLQYEAVWRLKSSGIWAVSIDNLLQTFQRSLLPPSSWYSMSYPIRLWSLSSMPSEPRNTQGSNTSIVWIGRTVFGLMR